MDDLREFAGVFCYIVGGLLSIVGAGYLIFNYIVPALVVYPSGMLLIGICLIGLGWAFLLD